MPKRRDPDDETVSTLATYAVGGAGLVGVRALGGLLREGRSSLHDLGPAPIGSDPWLLDEVRKALAETPGLAARDVQVEVRDAVVTLRGTLATAADVEAAERAARTVQGIKRLDVALRSR